MLPLALALFAVAHAPSAVPALLLCGKVGPWDLGSIATGAPATIAMRTNATQCLTVQTAPLSDGKTCAAAPDGRGCVTLGPCAAAGKWQLGPSKTAPGQSFITSVDISENGTFCLDFLSDKKGRDVAAQLAKCDQSRQQQHWIVDTDAGTIGAGWLAGLFLGVEGLACPNPPPPPPPPGASPFCAKYHPIHDGNVYDPSGPLRAHDGTWHTWEDDGGWSHWTSKDLIHWSGSFRESTRFGGDTGSVSPTPSGVCEELGACPGRSNPSSLNHHSGVSSKKRGEKKKKSAMRRLTRSCDCCMRRTLSRRRRLLADHGGRRRRWHCLGRLDGHRRPDQLDAAWPDHPHADADQHWL